MMTSARQGIPPDAINIHSTVIVLGDRGVAITGASGAGKTILALLLIRQFRSAGRFARLVSDDQVFVAARAGLLVAYAPEAISGLAEIRGLGPVERAYERTCVIDLVIELEEGRETPRHWPGETVSIADVIVPHFRLPGRDPVGNTIAIEEIVASALRPNDQVPANR